MPPPPLPGSTELPGAVRGAAAGGTGVWPEGPGVDLALSIVASGGLYLFIF